MNADVAIAWLVSRKTGGNYGADAEPTPNGALRLSLMRRLLGQNPYASIEEIANAGRLTRQTVYAHLASRDALVRAHADRATDRVTAALKAVDLGQGPASEALGRLVQISWETFAAEQSCSPCPARQTDADVELQRHQPVFETLEDLIGRSQREGDFDPSLPISWSIAATIALGHAAGDEVRVGRMTSCQASTVLRSAAQTPVR
jgi:AcrR family transcriptional regulator